MARTKQDLLAEAAKIEKRIASGKIPGKAKLKKEQQKMHSLRWRAKKAKGSTVVAAVKVKAKAEKPIDPKQGFIPGFLAQLDVVKIQEMIADRAFLAMKDALEESLGVTLRVTKAV